MNIADPKYLEHLRDLPSGYLLDLLADNEDMDKESVFWVLLERGFAREEIDRKLLRRKNSRWPRPYILWSAARWITLLNTLIVCYFNLSGFYELVHGEHAFKGALISLTIGCILFGFIVGFKLTTYTYQGGQSLIQCGFPVPVGSVDLKTGKEVLLNKVNMLLNMGINAIVGVSLTLFPLIFIYMIMD